MKTHLTFSLLALSLLLSFVSCSFDPASKRGNSDFSTRSIAPEEYIVSADDARMYATFKSTGKGPDFTEDWKPLSMFKMREVSVTAYPDNNNPLIYIINYPNNRWEVLSGDKRTVPVLAAGRGQFDMKGFNTNEIGWIKTMAENVKALRTYSEPVKDQEIHLESWCTMIEYGKYVDRTRQDNPVAFTDFQPKSQVLTRSTPDTTYHPVPGKYVLMMVSVDFIPAEVVNHLTGTKWGESYPYNQYCPINPQIPTQRAPAGSEAVAGGQLVHYMHSFVKGSLCPEIYGSAFCTAHIGDNPMDWTSMEQFDKSSSNWAGFQTSDSTRLAAVLLANIGSQMQMDYGVNYSSGDFSALQGVLYNEYGLESYELPFVNGPVNANTWIKESLEGGVPVIVHSGAGAENTLPYSFLIDGFRAGTNKEYACYKFQPYDPTDYEHIFFTEVFLKSSYPITYYCMNWGRNGTGSNDWCVNVDDWWCASTYDHSNRQSFLSFRLDGADPWAGTGNAK